MVEPAIEGIASEVPFADRKRGVTSVAHGLAHGNAPLVGQTHVLPVLPAHQRGAGGFTLRGVIKPGEAHPALGQAVQIRRLNFAAKTTEVGKPKVIRQNQNDVGPGGGGISRLCGEGNRKNREERREKFFRYHAGGEGS